MWDRIEEIRDVRVKCPAATPQPIGEKAAERIADRAAAAIGEAGIGKAGVKQLIKDERRGCLRNPIDKRGNCKTRTPPVAFGSSTRRSGRGR